VTLGRRRGQWQQPITLANNLTFTGTPFAPVAFTGSNLSFTGTVALTNNTALSVNNTTTFTGVVSGVGSLTLASTPVNAGGQHVHRYGGAI